VVAGRLGALQSPPQYSLATARRCGVRLASCAGAYVFGSWGSNECPAGSVRIETEAACRAAATAAGKTPNLIGFVGTSSTSPRGCSYASTNYAEFNPHAVGAGSSSKRLLCAAVTTGAP
jgi:hypothetical protein